MNETLEISLSYITAQRFISNTFCLLLLEDWLNFWGSRVHDSSDDICIHLIKLFCSQPHDFGYQWSNVNSMYA